MKKLILAFLLVGCTSGAQQSNNATVQDELEFEDAMKNGQASEPAPAMDNPKTNDGLDVSQDENEGLTQILKKKVRSRKALKKLPFCKKLMVANQAEPFCLAPKKGRDCFCHQNK